MTDTIFALSSGAPPAAIAVVRISGPAADEALQRIAGDLPPPRVLTLKALRVPATGELLDRALVARFPAESSVTGEALAELHLHGGRATIDAVSGALADMERLRPARAGEFTWRAFSNGKLDLVEVESLSDLLRAETEAQRRAALAEGGLSARVEMWRKDLLLLSALVEAALDQSDEDDVPADRSRIEAIATEMASEIGAMLDRPGAERLFDGVRVVFAGPPNAGKSTLINALAEREVAITSPIAGTTRDVIEVPVKLGGVAFVLADTAGLREGSADAIEREGISRARQRIEKADIVVWMDDSPPPLADPSKFVPILARADDPQRAALAHDRLAVSALTGEGLHELIAQLIERASRLLPVEGEVALSRRQRQHLELVNDRLVAFVCERDELLSAEHLRQVRAALDALTGRAGTEELLDALFGAFCIGK
ncbi:MAG: tRNA uridine-5-carboxymethylaminomethyl(34) synthesis GTPase MnmE [Proteobacteria bacterium]|nr:tRNA uridine-5-carboxymethylaminomethyl(34) synthesis GTPase MnmE [Pseudomonadota bacterium]